jgi:hypothetical protein
MSSSITDLSAEETKKDGERDLRETAKAQSKKVKQSKGKAKRKREHGSEREEVMHRTLREMVSDLSKVDGVAARNLQQLSRDYTGRDIIRELELSQSRLADSIMEGAVKIGATGKDYLFVFSLVRPAWKDAKENLPSSTAVAVITPASTAKEGTEAKKGDTKRKVATPSEAVEKILSDTKDKDMLLTLADSIFKDLDLGDRPNEEMGMQDMLSLMTKVGGAVQEKVSSGNLDMEKLQRQAMSFCEQIKENPELQTIIQGNPVLAGMHNNVQAQGMSGSSADAGQGPGISEPPGLGGMLLGMMSQFQGDMD